MTAPTGSQLARQKQALAQVGRTQLERRTGLSLVGFFILTLTLPLVLEVVVALGQGDERRTSLGAFSVLGEGIREAATRLDDGLAETNGAVLSAIETFEDRLQDESLLRHWLLPPTQWVLTAALGQGNEQTYVGKSGWLFFRPDVDYSLGRGFLEGAEQARRRLSLDSPADLQPDPVLALERFAVQLAERQIRLLVVPAPGKLVVYPQKLAPRRREVPVPAHNASFDELMQRLEEVGITVYDPQPDLAILRGKGIEAYLQTDSHWSPRAVQLVARALVERVKAVAELAAPPVQYRRRPARLAGRGDLESLLRLPARGRLFAEEQVEIARVTTQTGDRWRPARSSEVLLLGDSFANVFSDPALGWGSGAGLAEQLSHELGRPVDRITQNAGGAYRAREELARQLAADGARLDSTKVVIYEFATRELSSGDWRLVDLPTEGIRAP